MDLEEVYLRQIVEQLKLQNKLKEDGNDLLKEILNKLEKYLLISNLQGNVHDASSNYNKI